MKNNNIELLKRLKDPKFYLENYTKIKTKQQGSLAPFLLNEAQKDLFNTLKGENRIIINKARQMGFSTGVVGYFYHNTITNPGTNTAIIGYNSDLTAELLDKVKTFYRTTPASLKPTIQYNTKYEISFPTINSKIIVLPSSENVGVGYTLHNCLCTELSRWEKAEEKMMTLEASVPVNGKIVIESCVTGDTVVLTDKGPRSVGSIHSWKKEKLGFSKGKEIKIDGHYGLQSTNTYYNSGVQKGFRVETLSGGSVGMSSIHKMYVLRGSSLKFVKAKDLEIGDKLAVKYGQDLWGDEDFVNNSFLENHMYSTPEKITPGLAYLIGWIIGRGSFDSEKKTVTIEANDRSAFNTLLVENVGLSFKEDKGGSSYSCCSPSLVCFLEEFIEMKNSKESEREIPERVFKWSRSNVVAFLRGIINSRSSYDAKSNIISVLVKSKVLANQIRVLLLNLGVLSKTRSFDTSFKRKKKKNQLDYVIDFSCPSDLKDFSRKKNSKNVDSLIYGLGDVIKERRTEIGLEKSEIKFSEDMTYEELGKVIKKSRKKNSRLYKEILSLYELNYFYDEITEIVPIEENVYDFTVEQGHTVVYNGIVGHQTPKGAGNLYHRMWMADDNGYAKKEYGWWWGYEKSDLDLIAKRMNDPAKFAENYGMAFLTSGRSVFEASMLIGLRETVWKIGQEIQDLDGKRHTVKIVDGLRIFHDPLPDEQYVIGADVSEGVVGGDYSTAKIFRRSNGEEVASYRGLTPPDVFGDKLNTWGKKYNNAYLAVEINNHGLTTVTILKKHSYPSLYMRPSKFETASMSFSDKIGWRTTKVTRPLMIDEFAQACRSKDLTIHSKELVDEMSVFVYNDNGDMQPQSRLFHDDEIFAAAIAFQAFKRMYVGKLKQVNYADHLPSSGY